MSRPRFGELRDTRVEFATQVGENLNGFKRACDRMLEHVSTCRLWKI